MNDFVYFWHKSINLKLFRCSLNVLDGTNRSASEFCIRICIHICPIAWNTQKNQIKQVLTTFPCSLELLDSIFGESLLQIWRNNSIILTSFFEVVTGPQSRSYSSWLDRSLDATTAWHLKMKSSEKCPTHNDIWRWKVRKNVQLTVTLPLNTRVPPLN